jgi:hypothetical protein
MHLIPTFLLSLQLQIICHDLRFQSARQNDAEARPAEAQVEANTLTFLMCSTCVKKQSEQRFRMISLPPYKSCSLPSLISVCLCVQMYT